MMLITTQYFKNTLIVLLYFYLIGCSSNHRNKNVNTKTCYEKSIGDIDSLLSAEEKNRLLTSADVIVSKKFGMIKLKIIRAFSLDNSNACIPQYFLSNLDTSSVIKMSGILIEEYKRNKKYEAKSYLNSETYN